MTDLSDLLAPLIGHTLPGGCDSCEASQEIERHPLGSWVVKIFHDADCPVLARKSHRRGRRTR